MVKIVKKYTMKKIAFLLFICLATGSLQLKAQEYSTGIGVRGGYPSGLSIKHFVGSASAVEGILGAKWGGVQATVLYEIHAPAFSAEGLYWYYGIGGHIGFWDGYDRGPFDEDEDDFVGIGVDGVVGIEYKIQEIPITISLDLVPAFNIAENPGFWIDAGLGLRYVF